jgi:REP element-mobilizing transposase RayT
MPQERTEIIPGYFYHIYNRAVEGSLLFRERQNYSFFISRMRKYLLPASDILAFCLMPTHYHFLIKVKSESFPKSMQKLALSYAVAYNNLYDRKGHLFQGRYQKKHIQHRNYLLDLSSYIHLNPLKSNLVERAEDWEYSSYREYIGKRKRGLVMAEIVLDLLCEDLFSTITEQEEKYREIIENCYLKMKRD